MTADEPQYLLTALSLGEDASLDIGDERDEARFREFHEAALPVQEARQADGSRVSPHDPLLPALLAVPVALGGWLAAKLVLAGVAGLLAAAILWVAVRRFSVPLGVAVLVVLTFGLAAPLAVYATQVYPELPAALLVTVAVGALTGPLRRAGVARRGRDAGRAPVALGEVRARRRSRSRRSSSFDSGGAVTVACWARCSVALGLAAIAFLALHQLWYGGWTPYAAGSHFAGGELTVVGIRSRLRRSQRAAARSARRPRLRPRRLAARVPPRRAGPRRARGAPARGLGHARGPVRGRMAQRHLRRAHDARLVVARPPGGGRAAVRGARGRVVGCRVPAGTRARRGRSRAGRAHLRMADRGRAVRTT